MDSYPNKRHSEWPLPYQNIGSIKSIHTHSLFLHSTLTFNLYASLLKIEMTTEKNLKCSKSIWTRNGTPKKRWKRNIIKEDDNMKMKCSLALNIKDRNIPPTRHSFVWEIKMKFFPNVRSQDNNIRDRNNSSSRWWTRNKMWLIFLLIWEMCIIWSPKLDWKLVQKLVQN